MAADPTKCRECGARVKQRGAVFCLYCGARLPETEAAPAVSIRPLGDLDRRFYELDRHPVLADLMERSPPTARQGVALATQGLFFLVFAGFAVAFLMLVNTIGGQWFLQAVPIVFIIIGVIGFLATLARGATFSRSPLQRETAAIAGERTRVGGGGRSDGASTTYFVTLEYPGGDRREYVASGELCGEVTTGDVGVAYLKDDMLLDFKRVRV
jgi:hypothetical protein